MKMNPKKLFKENFRIHSLKMKFSIRIRVAKYITKNKSIRYPVQCTQGVNTSLYETFTEPDKRYLKINSKFLIHFE